MTHVVLVQIAYDWVLKNGYGCAFREFRTLACNGEFPDVIGFCSGGESVVVECKVSRADFLADQKKRFRRTPELGMGSKRFYCAPAGLIKPEELPAGWGLLEVNQKAKVKAVVHPWKDWKTRYDHNVKNWKAEHGLMYSALRRLHLRGRIEEVYDGTDKNFRLPINPDPNQSDLFTENKPL